MSATTVAILMHECLHGAGMIEALNAVPGLGFAGVWHHAREGLEGIARVAPDIVILDAGLAETSASTMVISILRSVPAARVILFTTRLDPEPLAEAMAAGARGFLMLHEPTDIPVWSTLLVGISGAALSHPDLKNILGTQFEKGLTSREHEVAELIASGLSNKQIAGRLNIRPFTVHGHLKSIFGKLNVRTRAELAVKYSNFQQLMTAFSETPPPH